MYKFVQIIMEVYKFVLVYIPTGYTLVTFYSLQIYTGNGEASNRWIEEQYLKLNHIPLLENPDPKNRRKIVIWTETVSNAYFTIWI